MGQSCQSGDEGHVRSRAHSLADLSGYHQPRYGSGLDTASWDGTVCQTLSGPSNDKQLDLSRRKLSKPISKRAKTLGEV